MELNDDKTVSTTEAAKLCRVSRGTVSYWIQKKKLYARRSGRNYAIPVNDLLLFLKSAGQQIPPELINGNRHHAGFRTVQPCWEYHQGNRHGRHCRDCIVLNNQLNVCFISRASRTNQCEMECNECRYFREIYLPRTQFIQQIDLAAAVYRDLFFWAGNLKFAELCEVREKDLVGMGLECVVHPDSMETVIRNAKKRAMGDPDAPRTYTIFLKNRRAGKVKVNLGVYPLVEPPGAHLLVAEPENVHTSQDAPVLK
jgi:excisionase family DNA binding protein